MTTETRVPMRFSLASAFVALAIFTSTWTGVTVGRLNVTDLFLAAASLAVALSSRKAPRLHLWMLSPSCAVVAVVAIDAIARPSVYDAGSLLYIVKMLAATAVIPALLQSEAEAGGSSRLTRHACWFANGMTVNSLAAILIGRDQVDVSGFVDQTVKDRADVANPLDFRVAGLAFHPNSLAFSLVIALPTFVLLLEFASRPVARAWWILSLASSIWALFLANSRAGLAVGLTVTALSLTLVVRKRSRVFWPVLILAGTLAAFVWIPHVLSQTRLAAGVGRLSNIGRERANSAAFEAFLGNPVFGGGFATQTGVAIPLELASAGGLFLLVGYYIFYTGFTREYLSHPGNVATFGWLVVAAIVGYSAFSAGSTERATYVVPLLLSNMLALRGRDAERGSKGRWQPIFRDSSPTGSAVSSVDGAISDRGSDLRECLS